MKGKSLLMDVNSTSSKVLLFEPSNGLYKNLVLTAFSETLQRLLITIFFVEKCFRNLQQ